MRQLARRRTIQLEDHTAPTRDATPPARFLSPDGGRPHPDRADLRATDVVEGHHRYDKRPVRRDSVEFVPHREYVRGDNLRPPRLEGRSKTDQLHIKQFEGEGPTCVDMSWT